MYYRRIKEGFLLKYIPSEWKQNSGSGQGISIWHQKIHGISIDFMTAQYANWGQVIIAYFRTGVGTSIEIAFEYNGDFVLSVNDYSANQIIDKCTSLVGNWFMEDLRELIFSAGIIEGRKQMKKELVELANSIKC